MKRCLRCHMPETRPGSIFKEGVCQACLNYDNRKKVDWEKRKAELAAICNKFRDKNKTHDCLIPVSGGKDSYFLVHTMVCEMGMHPLLITITDSFTHTQAGVHNIRNLITAFKADHYQYTINHDLFIRATRAAFEGAGEALKFVESAIYTIPALFAQKFDIPLVIFGENSAYEYGSSENDSGDAGQAVSAISAKLEQDFAFWKTAGLTEQEVRSIQIDKSKQLPTILFLNYFTPWSSTAHLEIAKRHGFKDLSGEWDREGYIENFEQIDSIGYLVHLWLKYPKFGFQRTSDIASRRVREGLLTLAQAEKLIRENDYKLDQRALDDFANTLGYTRQQFWEIAEKFWDRNLFMKEKGAWRAKE